MIALLLAKADDLPPAVPNWPTAIVLVVLLFVLGWIWKHR